MKCPLIVNMHRKTALHIGFVALLLLSLAVVIPVPVSGEHAAQAMWVEPAFTYLQECGDFTVDVMINVTDPPGDGAGMFGFQYKLFWNSTVLEAVEIQTHGDNIPVGDRLTGWDMVFVVTNDTAPSYHSYAVAAVTGSAFTGVASLCTYKFHVKSNGSCALDIYDDILVDDTATPITHNTVDGYFSDPFPRALFAHEPKYPDVNQTVTFNASASFDPDSTIVSYAWDFGDGTTDTGMIVYHNYTAKGTYTVKLTVTDNDGRTSTLLKDVKVGGVIAIITYLPTDPLVNQTVTFNATASFDPDGYIVSYTWNFGDNTTNTGVIVYHNYTAAGIYNVTLMVTDNATVPNTDTTLDTVKVGRWPVPKFTFNPEKPLVNHNVTFDASESHDTHPDQNGTIVSYAWDFGDGTTGTGNVTTYNYRTFGTRDVTLTVTDNEGLTNSTSKPITVFAKPVANFTWSPETPKVGETVALDASASNDPDGDIILYDWIFGDFTKDTDPSPIMSKTYAIAGVYTITLTVTDNDGVSGFETARITVRKNPVADFAWSPETPKVGETVTFNGALSTPNGGSIESYVWNFGDNTTDTGMSVDHSYTVAGIYNVTLTVTDDEALSHNCTKSITIARGNSTISISASPTIIKVGENTTIRGIITPTRAEQNVTIYYRLDGGTWKTLAMVTTDSDGKYSYVWTPLELGTYEVNASWSGDAITLAAESSVITLTVEKVAPTGYLLYAAIAIVTIISAAIAIYIRVRIPWLARAFFQQRAMVLLLMVILIVGVGATGYVNRPREEPPPPPPPPPGAPGELPTWTVGDSWLFIDVVNDTAYDLDQTVVGEATINGTDCYEVTLVWSPDTPRAAALGLHNDMKMWLDKESLRAVKLNATGEVLSFPYVYTLTYSYEIEMINGTASWPRVVGNEWKRNTTTTQIVLVGGSPFEDLCKTYWNVTWIKVEAFENVTVPAGTFECFRVATYNETGDGLLSVSWHSDDVRTSVKSIDYGAVGYKSSQFGPDTRELERAPT